MNTVVRNAQNIRPQSSDGKVKAAGAVSYEYQKTKASGAISALSQIEAKPGASSKAEHPSVF